MAVKGFTGLAPVFIQFKFMKDTKSNYDNFCQF